MLTAARTNPQNLQVVVAKVRQLAFDANLPMEQFSSMENLIQQTWVNEGVSSRAEETGDPHWSVWMCVDVCGNSQVRPHDRRDPNLKSPHSNDIHVASNEITHTRIQYTLQMCRVKSASDALRIKFQAVPQGVSLVCTGFVQVCTIFSQSHSYQSYEGWIHLME